VSTFRLGVLLRNLAWLGIAGAAGCALEHTDDHAIKASDYELFPPQYTAPAPAGKVRWYPTVVLHPGNDLFPAMGNASETDPPTAGEEIVKGRAPLLPDGSVLALDHATRDEFEVWPNNALPNGTAPSRCYPPVVPHHDHLGPMPISGGAWQIAIERPTWEAIAPALGSRFYHGGPVLLPDSRVLVPANVPPRSTDPSPPSPPTGR